MGQRSTFRHACFICYISSLSEKSQLPVHNLLIGRLYVCTCLPICLSVVCALTMSCPMSDMLTNPHVQSCCIFPSVCHNTAVNLICLASFVRWRIVKISWDCSQDGNNAMCSLFHPTIWFMGRHWLESKFGYYKVSLMWHLVAQISYNEMVHKKCDSGIDGHPGWLTEVWERE